MPLEVLVEESGRCSMYHVNYRWLGGTMTNWQERKVHQRLLALEKARDEGRFEVLTKKALELIARLNG